MEKISTVSDIRHPESLSFGGTARQIGDQMSLHAHLVRVCCGEGRNMPGLSWGIWMHGIN